MSEFKVGVQLQPQATTIKDLRHAWQHADSIGVDTIWVWDHFYPLYGDPAAAHFEAWTLLAAIAESTSHARFGAMVTCNTYRNPDLLADMARTVDQLSDGRLILGIGSGWFERDYTEYGYEFDTAPERLRLLAEALPRIKARLARLNPGPAGPLPILIGGGGEKVTLRLVAEHAQMWNSGGTPDSLRHKNSVLDEWCVKLGRDPAEIERTALVRPDIAPDDYVGSGVDHLIVMVGHPFDLQPVERLLAARG